MKKSFIYKPTYKLRCVDYQRSVGNDGYEIESIVFFKRDEHMIENPPNYLKEYEKIKKILEKTGIAKITITRLNNP